ncbi:meiotic recombination protein DMC1 homolog isoform X3 [Bidens hawaiensis]|uniref:meiotic recombination protein DMC1 homolog isoform X3 n=1 Tax=Bidens hawaiensis TaxID=980011 RepID=UPI00404B3212
MLLPRLNSTQPSGQRPIGACTLIFRHRFIHFLFHNFKTQNQLSRSIYLSTTLSQSVICINLNSKMLVYKSEESSHLQLIERDDIIDEDEDLFEAIDKLTSHGINAGDVKKLQDAGIYTCNGLMMHTKKNLTGIKGLSEAKVDKICEAAEKLVNFGYITGSDALLRRKAVVRITTGSQALDELLGGGIETLQITEAFGEFRSGKTQLAHTLCVTTQLPTNMKGGNGKVAYIDTEGTFRPDRIVPIAERFGMDAGAVLDNIIYARAYTYEHQYNLLLGLAAKMSEEPYRLLIVDSVIALFRVDFTGRGELADRQQKLAQMLSRLTKIAEEFNVAVYMTNQVIADPGGGVFISDPKKPAGGHVLAHAATVRLMFRKGKGEQRVCKVFDAPNLPESEAISLQTYKNHIFQITPGGIADAKD